MSVGKIVLALDGMGGDHAPAVIVNGADIARERYPGTSFLLFGDPARLKPLVDKRKGLAKALEIVPAERLVINPDCGCVHLPRDVAFNKLAAMVEGTKMVRADLGK